MLIRSARRLSHIAFVVAAVAMLFAVPVACSSSDSAIAKDDPSGASAAAPDVHQFCGLAIDQVSSLKQDLLRMTTTGTVDPSVLPKVKAASEKVLAAAPAAIRADTKVLLDISVKAQEAQASGDASTLMGLVQSPVTQGAMQRYSTWIKANCSQELTAAGSTTTTTGA